MTTNSEKRKIGEQLRDEREKRITDAIHLKMTDRVPIICGMGYFPAKFAGIKCSAAYYDFEAWYDAYKKTLPHYPADMLYSQPFTPGKALEILDPKQSLWPGFNCSPDHGHQTHEIENMEADEYEAFMNDPADYMFRIHMSRISDKLAGLATIPPLSDFHGDRGAQALAMAMTSPEADKAIETLLQVGRELRKWQSQTDKFDEMMLEFGYGPYFQGAELPPFDIISHSMRGMKGTMMDMYRQPDKVLAACEKILELALARPLPKPTALGNVRIFMTNTRGSDDFMSKKHFDTFYWPTMRKLVHGLIEKGATPCIFFEGNFTSRLEYLLDFPKGKLLARLDTTDIFKAKEILKDHICIEGNVPSTLLQVGTVFRM
jgi:hypothetical protein